MNKKIIIICFLLFISIISYCVSSSSKNVDNNPVSEFELNDSIINEVIGNSYIDNGISLRISILNISSPLLIFYNNKQKFEYELVNIFDDEYDVMIDLSNLDNGIYNVALIDQDLKHIVPLKNKLDILERLARSKIANKLVTFNYENDITTVLIEDFEYKYDIFIDPGHGGIDSGTINKTIIESELNLKQSLYEKMRYEQHGLRVLLSRSDESDGMLYDNNEWNRAKRRGYLLGYYGVLSKIVYSNHHNYSTDFSKSGFEILVSNSFDSDDLKTELKIVNSLKDVYPSNLITNTFQIYSRDYEEGNVFNKINGKVYDYKDYYATIRIPLELYNVKTVTYEGCYMSNQANFEWYYNEGYKIMSEIKIKNYVEELGKTYIPI